MARLNGPPDNGGGPKGGAKRGMIRGGDRSASRTRLRITLRLMSDAVGRRSMTQGGRPRRISSRHLGASLLPSLRPAKLPIGIIVCRINGRAREPNQDASKTFARSKLAPTPFASDGQPLIAFSRF